MTVSFCMQPMLPTLSRGLEERALAVYQASSRLAGKVHPATAAKLVPLLRSVNSYYSNLIEGIRTSLVDIERGQRELSEDQRIRRLQILHRQNIAAQLALEDRCAPGSADVTSQVFLCSLHELLFAGVPEEFLEQRDSSGARRLVMQPGALRGVDVVVGGHVPPPAEELQPLLAVFSRAYSLERVQGTMRLVAAAAGHHRLLWIHPFLEGNGRLVRLFTDIYLKCAGLEGYGIWTMSRGFARNEALYKRLLAGADAARQGDYDGRGNLSERGLRSFCSFFLETALDQIQFMESLLQLDAAERNIELYCRLRREGHVPGMAALPREAAPILCRAFSHGQLPKSEVPGIINASERKARDVVKALVAEGLLEAEHRKAPLTMGFPAEAVRFIFPDLCDPGAY